MLTQENPHAGDMGADDAESSEGKPTVSFPSVIVNRFKQLNALLSTPRLAVLQWQIIVIIQMILILRMAGGAR